MFNWISKITYWYRPPQEDAQYGQHVWSETSPAGDFCYVGETYCFAKSLVGCVLSETSANVHQINDECCSRAPSTVEMLPVQTQVHYKVATISFLQQKSLPRHKCAACKIAVHTVCMDQLEKVRKVSVDLCSLI